MLSLSASRQRGSPFWATTMSDQWTETTLGEVASWGSGGTPKAGKAEYYEGGTIPWAVIADVQDGPIAVTERGLTPLGVAQIGHTAPPNAVLVTMYGTIGRVGLTEVELATNQAIAWGVANERILLPKFLFYWLRNHRQTLDGLGRGATQRNINREIIKSQVIKLPPLNVQRRIVDLMEHLDSQVAGLRNESAAVEHLIFVFRESHFQRWRSETPTVSFGSITNDVRRPLAVSPEETYRQIGVRSHGRGVFGKEAKTGQDLGSKKMYTVSSGDLVFNIVFAWEGAVAIVPDDFEGWASSHRFPTYRRVDGGSEEFLRHFFISAWGNEELRLASPGGAGRNRTLGRKALSMIQVPQVHRDQESEFLDQMRQFAQLSISLTREQAAAEEACRTLLRSLLAQSIDIPDAYDDVLVVAS